MNNIQLITPIFAPKTWGNNDAIVSFLGKDHHHAETIGEIFLASGLSEQEGGSTKIGNRTIRDIFNDKKHKTEIFGDAFLNTEEFPLLLKILAIKEPLSLQVHPGDEFLGNKRIFGKTEAWYALADSQVLCGFKEGFGEQDFKALIEQGFFEKEHAIGDLAKFCNLIDLKKGEALYVESGTIHTILSGLLLEPQQPCNTTFRIYDWGRNDAKRPLHLEKALNVLKYDSRPQKVQGTGVFFDKPNFKVERSTVHNERSLTLDQSMFHLLVPCEGPITIKSTGTLTLAQGTCVLIPAHTGTLELRTTTAVDVFVISPKI